MQPLSLHTPKDFPPLLSVYLFALLHFFYQSLLPPLILCPLASYDYISSYDIKCNLDI